MNIPFKLCLILFMGPLILAGCGSSVSQEKELITVATPIGVEFIKEHYNADFILKDYTVDDPAVHSRIYLYGYIKGHEDSKITIYYSYKTKEVIDVSGPDWFIDSEVPKYKTPSS
ncbi:MULTISPECIES: hypothetical protein [Paenibacillus]|uniref:DUF3139 domain-containing protein n=2 Tax=Paenibacillus TaxID=44249 RepID=E3EAX7_PAEPS|nr:MULTISPECIES: hypothetical protein [Paenibacillus]ADO59041.1 hypothetical protein PPSC2_23935 [Paenibacillus polymyxa SC2]KAF6567645.1 hypothetical protein G9G63_03265 [Paenibacillus sp. EKM202P]KAF6573240.1 hypothetical protein G9G64_00695 [Paenibacillus sp. EKM207P]WPQ56631.1 hypothetical protein SKN87_24310 [Paenibacillus polymyxa]